MASITANILLPRIRKKIQAQIKPPIKETITGARFDINYLTAQFRITAFVGEKKVATATAEIVEYSDLSEILMSRATTAANIEGIKIEGIILKLDFVNKLTPATLFYRDNKDVPGMQEIATMF